jgi:hypothetical protein
MLAAVSAQAQGTFQNNNFEQANPVSLGGIYVTAASALPGWTAAIGGVEQTSVWYNGASTGSPEVVLLGPPPPNPALPVIDGNYSVLLTATDATASISQTGLIPAGTQSLYFEAEPGKGALDVLVGNQEVPIAAVGSGPNYTLYGANISAWARDTEQLTFSAQEYASGLNNWVLDDISFSNQSVPEPSPVALTGLGAFVFALYRRFAPKRP